MTPKRILWIDIAKAIGILTIVIGHTSFLIGSNFLPPLLNPWKVLIFPFLGGYLFKRSNSFIPFLARKAKDLLIPYLIAVTAGFAVWSFVTRFPPYDSFRWDLPGEILHIVTGTQMLSNCPVWFIPAYFIALIMMYFVYPLLEKAGVILKVAVSVVIFLLFTFINPGRWMLPYSIDLSLLFFGFFVLGFTAKDAKIQFIYDKKYILTALAIFTVAGEWNRSVDIYQRIFGRYPLFFITAIIGVYLVVYLAKALARIEKLSNYLAVIGRQSLLLMSSHGPLMQLTTLALYSSGALKQFHLVFNLSNFWFEGNNAAYIRFWATLFLFLYVVVILTAVKSMVYLYRLGMKFISR